MGGNRSRHGVHAEKRPFGGIRIGDFQAIGFVQGDDKLEGIDRIEANASGPEERLAVDDFLRFELQHEIFHHELFDVVLERCCIFHFKTD